jgi:hypothetical protein
VNIVAGRATFTDGPPKLYPYVHREVTSAAARLDQFLSRKGVASDERVTVISDDAGEFAKTVEDSQLARARILDWFHIAMKFQAAQRSVFGSKMLGSIAKFRWFPYGAQHDKGKPRRHPEVESRGAGSADDPGRTTRRSARRDLSCERSNCRSLRARTTREEVNSIVVGTGKQQSELLDALRTAFPVRRFVRGARTSRKVLRPNVEIYRNQGLGGSTAE